MFKNKQIRLSKLADVRSGVTFRTKVSHVKDGDTSVIQMRDVSYENLTISEDVSRIDGRIFKEDSYLKVNDLLFVAKGSKNYSVLYAGQFEKAVAISFFFVIRPKEHIDASYLNWYLNSSLAQREFHKGSEGTQIRSISKSSLQDLPVILPSYQDQKKVGSLYALMNKEAQLMDILKEKRKQLASRSLINFVTN